jgi:hypothetical protein
MIGVSAVTGSARSRSAARKPSITGIITSSRIRSGRNRRASAVAASALPRSRTV